MPAALIWYLVKPRRESGASILEGTQRGAQSGRIAHNLLLLVVLLQFGAVIPPVCATREREEQGPLQEGDARERRRKSQRSGKWSGSGRARKRGDIVEHISARQP